MVQGRSVALKSRSPIDPKERKAEANLQSIVRIFTVPENEHTTLGRIEKEISQNLMGFLKEHIVAQETATSDLERDFIDTVIPENPSFVSEQAEFLLSKVVAQSVHVASPSFVGHMTSALPYFMLPLTKIMIALNQNLVKIETAKAFTPLERQVIGMLHRLVYGFSDDYYKKHTQDYECALGAFSSGGTVANITALWVAVNRLLPARDSFAGLAEEGVYAALEHYGLKGLAILVSRRGHYSLKKAANLLGIGKRNLIAIPTDAANKIRLDALEAEVQRLRKEKIGIVAVVGIAGTTETGSVDPLAELAALCRQYHIHFHVDAAWGGPTLFSNANRYLLRGIEEADSVAFDAHKQLYTPVGAGITLMKSETALQLIEHHAQYIIRKGSRDLGRWTLEGSRQGTAMLVHSGLKIIGRRGYEILIDMGIKKAKDFAAMIKREPDFELVTEPELNLLTYRYVPARLMASIQSMSPVEKLRWNEELNRLTIALQKDQREAGKTFVSRTTLEPVAYEEQPTTVFRVVLANPLTTLEILGDMLKEQRTIGEAIVLAEGFEELKSWL